MTSHRRVPRVLVFVLLLGLLLSVPWLYLFFIQPHYTEQMHELNGKLDTANHEVVQVGYAERQPAGIRAEREMLQRRIRAQQHIGSNRDLQHITLAVRELTNIPGVTLSEEAGRMHGATSVRWTAQVDADSFDTLSDLESDLASIGAGIHAIDARRQEDGRVRGSFEIAVALWDPTDGVVFR